MSSHDHLILFTEPAWSIAKIEQIRKTTATTDHTNYPRITTMCELLHHATHDSVYPTTHELSLQATPVALCPGIHW
jgi:hypothetical protein